MDESWRLEKLIRDRIPELIRASGQSLFQRQLDDRAIRPYLAYKLLEEAREAYQAFLSGDQVMLKEELADVLEVLDRVVEISGLDWNEVRSTQIRKAQDRGRFQENRLLPLPENIPYRLHPGPQRPLLQVLRRELARCRSAYLAVAFVMDSGMTLLSNALAAALARGARIRLLTTDYLDITEPQALEQLIRLPGDIEVRLYSEPGRSYHPKAYLFEHDEAFGRGVAFIGSSNLSRAALETGIEWNYEIHDADSGWPLHDFIQHFQALFDSPHSDLATPDLIRAYRERRRPRSPVDEERLVHRELPTPRPAQAEALTQLEGLRAEGEMRGLVIAATGIGKTFLAAFDSRPYFRVLFIAHRLELLTQAEQSFRAVRPFDQTGFYHGEQRDGQAKLLFASIHTLGRAEHLEQFAPDYFDYLVVDEFHHAAAPSYQAILAHFQPRFLLGLTATPYRSDNRDIFALCHGNIAYRLTLFEAIGFGWLCPFHYYGVYDDTDYSAIPWRSGRYDETILNQALENQRRAEAILENYRRHPSQAALGFCVSISHARFMADYFNDQGIPALAVHSGPDSIPRESAIQALQQGAVRTLFTVDLFNEGVDIPRVDLVMFLRPTESMTVFLQQLGRGLRLHPGKAFLTALDFIGNYRNAHYKLPLLAGQGDEPDVTTAGRALKALESGAFEKELPVGVKVHFDLQAIDLFKILIRQGEPLRQRLTEAFQELNKELGHRPSLLEMHRQGRYDVRQYLQAFGNWYRFLATIDKQSPADAVLEREVGNFLAELEKTRMTKSYKMVVLQALLERTRLAKLIGIAELIQDFRYFFAVPRYQRDIQDTEIEAIEAVSDSQLGIYLEKNPLAAWTNPGNSQRTVFFTYDSETGEFLYTGPQASDGALFLTAVQERIEYRLEAYFERKFERHNLFKVINGGKDRGIIMLGEHPQSPIPRDQNWKVVLIDGQRMYAKFAKIAINVLKDVPTEESSVPNRLTEILERWFGPHGYLPGRGNQVRITRAPDEEDVWVIEPVPGTSLEANMNSNKASSH